MLFKFPHWYCAWWRPEGQNIAINKFIWSSYLQCADFTPPFSLKLLSCPAPEPDLGVWDVHTCLVYLKLFNAQWTNMNDQVFVLNNIHKH